MTLILDLDLDILKTPHVNNEVSRLRLSKVRDRTGQTDRQRDKQTRSKVLPRRMFAGGNQRCIGLHGDN